MSAYRLSHAAAVSLRRRIMFAAAAVMLLAVAGAVGMSMTRAESTEAIVIAAPLVLAGIAAAAFIAYRQRLAKLDSFGLSVMETQLTRRMADAPTITLQRDDVKRIERHRSGAITIHTSRETFRIPAEIEDRDALLAELARWGPIENRET